MSTPATIHLALSRAEAATIVEIIDETGRLGESEAKLVDSARQVLTNTFPIRLPLPQAQAVLEVIDDLGFEDDEPIADLISMAIAQHENRA